jgi:hypothetical protein
MHLLLLLFARCAGIHVDFHAHRHFDNFRCFPGHLGPPGDYGSMFVPE